MFYDLHVHSALSPCADNDMTPASVAGFLALSGAEVIAVSDHNSALNLPAAAAACVNYGIKLLPAIEVNTAEEIHLLCYFPTVESALSVGEKIYESLPDIPIDSSIWGEQLIFDAEDRITGKLEKLLTLACGFGIYEMARMVNDLGGIAIPAHADKNSFSALSVLGFLPSDLNFAAVELANPHKYKEYSERGLLPEGLATLTSSDAHSLAQLTREPLPHLEDAHPLMGLIRGL